MLNDKQLVTCRLAYYSAKWVFKWAKGPFKRSKQPIKWKHCTTV